jgi:hypothetical protein
MAICPDPTRDTVSLNVSVEIAVTGMTNVLDMFLISA